MKSAQPERILIAALAESNRAIGYNGKLPWHIPADLHRFQQLTLGYPIIMGRNTWEHDLERRPLKQRLNIIVSSTLPPSECDRPEADPALGIRVVPSLSAALAGCAGWSKVFIIGGAALYTTALTWVDRWELTLVDGEFDGDRFFPAYQHLIGSYVQRVAQECHIGYRFETYRRIRATDTTATHRS